jgi:4a-hydroxytetrahydrobiopterin dehydratase
MALLDEEQIEESLQGAEGWARDGDAIVKEFELKDFVGSVEFVNRITPVAEEMNHHPDVTINWNKVRLSLSTHSEGGLTENDFVLAGRIDGLA